jgi:hypothetical protein
MQPCLRNNLRDHLKKKRVSQLCKSNRNEVHKGLVRTQTVCHRIAREYSKGDDPREKGKRKTNGNESEIYEIAINVSRAVDCHIHSPAVSLKTFGSRLGVCTSHRRKFFHLPPLRFLQLHDITTPSNITKPSPPPPTEHTRWPNARRGRKVGKSVGQFAVL